MTQYMRKKQKEMEVTQKKLEERKFLILSENKYWVIKHKIIKDLNGREISIRRISIEKKCNFWNSGNGKNSKRIEYKSREI